MSDEAAQLATDDPDYAIRDLYNHISEGDFPSWSLKIQVMTFEEAEKFRYNPFDLTKVQCSLLSFYLHTYILSAKYWFLIQRLEDGLNGYLCGSFVISFIGQESLLLRRLDGQQIYHQILIKSLTMIL